MTSWLTPLKHTTPLLSLSKAVHTSVAAYVLNTLASQSLMANHQAPITMRSLKCGTLTVEIAHTQINAENASLYLFSDMSAMLAKFDPSNGTWRVLPAVLRMTSIAPKSLGFDNGERLINTSLGGRRNSLTLSVATKHWPRGDGACAAALMRPYHNFSSYSNGSMTNLQHAVLANIIAWAATIDAAPLISANRADLDPSTPAYVPPFASLHWVRNHDAIKAWASGLFAYLPNNAEIHVCGAMITPQGTLDTNTGSVLINGIICDKSTRLLHRLMQASPWGTPHDLVHQTWVKDSALRNPSKLRAQSLFLLRSMPPMLSAHDAMRLATLLQEHPTHELQAQPA